MYLCIYILSSYYFAISLDTGVCWAKVCDNDILTLDARFFCSLLFVIKTQQTSQYTIKADLMPDALFSWTKP